MAQNAQLNCIPLCARWERVLCKHRMWCAKSVVRTHQQNAWRCHSKVGSQLLHMQRACDNALRKCFSHKESRHTHATCTHAHFSCSFRSDPCMCAKAKSCVQLPYSPLPAYCCSSCCIGSPFSHAKSHAIAFRGALPTCATAAAYCSREML